MDDAAEAPDSQGGRGRRATRLVVVIVLVVVYVGSLVGYGYSINTRGTFDIDQADSGVVVAFQATDIDAPRGVVGLNATINFGSELVDDSGLLSKDLLVTLVPAFTSTLAIPAGSEWVYTNRRVEVPVEIAVQNYPFDGYDVPLVVVVQARDSATDPYQAVPVSSGVSSDLLGWVVRRNADVVADEADRAQGATSIAFTMRRSGSTVAISVLLLTLMVVLGVLAVLVARAVSLGRRMPEAGFAGWFAAMLFALIPLRLNLPGAPPLGAWVDYLVFFWVEVVLIVALAAFVDAWLRGGPRPRNTR